MLERSVLIGQITKAAETLRQLEKKQYPHVMQVMYFSEQKESKDKAQQLTLIDDFKANSDLSITEKFLEPVLELKKTLDKINLSLIQEIKSGKKENDAEGNLKYLLEHFSLEDLSDSELSTLEQNLELIYKCFQSSEIIDKSLGIIIYQVSSLVGIIASRIKPHEDKKSENHQISAPIDPKIATHLTKISALHAIKHNHVLYDLFKHFLDAKDFDQALLAITRLGEYLQTLPKDIADKISTIPFGVLNLLTPKHRTFLAQMQPITKIQFAEHDQISPVQTSFELGLSKVFDLCKGDAILKSMVGDEEISPQAKNKFLKLIKETSARRQYEIKILNPIEKLFYKIIDSKDNMGAMILGIIQLGEFCHQMLPGKSIKEILSQIFQYRGIFSNFNLKNLEYLIAIEAAIRNEPKSPHRALLETGTKLFRGIVEKSPAITRYHPILHKELEQQAGLFIKTKLIPLSEERLEIEEKIKRLEKLAHNDEDDILFYTDQVRLSSDIYYSSSSDLSDRKLLEQKIASAQEQINLRDRKQIAEQIKEKISSVSMQQLSFSFLKSLKRTDLTGFFAISDMFLENKFNIFAKKSKEQKIDIDHSQFTKLIAESQIQKFFENLSELNQLIARYCDKFSLSDDDKLNEDDRLAILIELIPSDDTISLLSKSELLYGAICKAGSTFLNIENILFSFILALRSKINDDRPLKTILEQKQHEEINYLQEIYTIALQINQSADLKSAERDKLVGQISEIKKIALERRRENKAIFKELKIVNSILGKPDPEEIPNWLEDVELIESLSKRESLTEDENIKLLSTCEKLPKHKKPTDALVTPRKSLEEKAPERKTVLAPEDLKLTLNEAEQTQLSAMSVISTFYYRVEYHIKSEQHKILFTLVSDAVNAKNIKDFLDAIYKLSEQQKTDGFYFNFFQALSVDIEIFIKQIRYTIEKAETNQYKEVYEQLSEGLEIFEGLLNLDGPVFARTPKNLQFVEDINIWAKNKSITLTESGEIKQIHTASTVSESPPSHASLISTTSISQSSALSSPVSEEKDLHASERSPSPTLSSTSSSDSKTTARHQSIPKPSFFKKAILYIKQNPGKTFLYGLLGIAFIALCIVTGGASLAAALGGMAFLAALKTGASILLINYVLTVTILGGAALGMGTKGAWESTKMSDADYYSALQARGDITSQQRSDSSRKSMTRTRAQSYSGPLRSMISTDPITRPSTSVEKPTAVAEVKQSRKEKESVQIEPLGQQRTRTLSQ